MNGKRGSMILLISEVVMLIVTVVLCVVRILNPQDTTILKAEMAGSEAMAETMDISNWNQTAESDKIQPQEAEPETEAKTESEEILETTEKIAEEETEEIINPYPQEARDKLAGMTIEEKIAQMFVVAPEEITGVVTQTAAGPSTEKNYGLYPVGGIVFNNNNYNGDERSKALLEGFEEIAYKRSGLNIFMVFRERAEEFRVAVADTFNGEEVFELYKKTTFEEIPQKAHLIPTYQGEFIDTEGYQLLMVSNEKNQELTGTDIPICFIPEQYAALRDSYGVYILLMTQSLSDDRIRNNYSSEEAAVLAINAGADLIYRPNSFIKAYDEVVRAVADGRITEERINEAVLKIITYKMNFEAYTKAPARSFPTTHTTSHNSNTQNTNTQNPEGQSTDNTQQSEQGAGNGEQAPQTQQQPAAQEQQQPAAQEQQQPAAQEQQQPAAQQQPEQQQQPTPNPENPPVAGNT